MHAYRALRPESTSSWKANLVVLGVAGLLIAAPSPSRAQAVCADADNRTLNCDFATGIAYWVPEIGSSFVHSPDGHEGPGSIEVESALVSDHIAKINQCVGGLAGLASVDVGAWYRLAAGSSYGCGLEATKYADDNCTTPMGSRGWYTNVFSQVWTWIGGSFDLDPGVRGIRISPICYSMVGTFSVRIDDVYLGEGVSTILFIGCFESGDTTGWSSAVP